ncbi:MAG: hypothetical protein M1503_06065 [Thaumarchaeota archaeon]|nr:hypothetical protein [Nitrososphaerota archaeon]MCL5317808.1 hypothetical protein [Nitrososphaerota archaeon]
MERAYWCFKLFNSVKEKHEVDFAELELSSLFGEVKRIRNFYDTLSQTPFANFTKKTRIQDYLTHELPYGECVGFYAETNKWPKVDKLVRRLAYIREFFVAVEQDNAENILKKAFPTGELGKNVQLFKEGGLTLFRFTTNQYFLEKTQYVSKLSRDEQEVDSNVETLLTFLTKQINRIPASSTMQVGKRLEDYFATREEPSLHLTHYMHPYKGKFHPKMVRALLNYVHPEDGGVVMDNFAGCGTLLVEATWMGLDSRGVEINPLSALMSNVKCNSLNLDPAALKKEIHVLLQTLRNITPADDGSVSPRKQPITAKYDANILRRRQDAIPKKVLKMFSDPEVINSILLARQLIEQIKDQDTRNFLIIGLSGTISDMLRRRNSDFLTVLEDRLVDIYLRIYIFYKLNAVLKIKLGTSETLIGDTRDMSGSCYRLNGKPVKIDDGEIKAIVNSPPYSTALDYIRNDYPQLTILGLADIEQLEKKMMGNPNARVYPSDLLQEIQRGNQDYQILPENAKKIVNALLEAERKKEALRTYRFFKDMRKTLQEMYRVLETDCKAVIIIGNNHYKLNGKYVEVRNDEIIKQMGTQIGFRENKLIRRELEKSMAGMIRYESILILQKST